MNAIQDYYPDALGHCFGCGKNNPRGHHLKSYWDGEQTTARFTPEPFHLAIPGYVYGGLIASLIDCHGTGTAAAATAREQGRSLDSDPPPRFVTASITVDFLAPTPIGVELKLHGEVREISARKVISEVTVSARNKICARGRVIAVRMPENMLPSDDSAD